jgi:hypothetical protein
MTTSTTSGLAKVLANTTQADLKLTPVSPKITGFTPVSTENLVKLETPKLTTDVMKNTSKDIQDSTAAAIAQTGKETAGLGGDTPIGESGFFNNLFSDKYKMGNILGLAGGLAQLASLPLQRKLAKNQLEQNRFALQEARDESARQKRMSANFSNASRSQNA